MSLARHSAAGAAWAEGAAEQCAPFFEVVRHSAISGLQALCGPSAPHIQTVRLPQARAVCAAVDVLAQVSPPESSAQGDAAGRSGRVVVAHRPPKVLQKLRNSM